MAKETKQEALGIRPLGDRIVVKPAQKDEVSAMGIILPESSKGEAPSRGTVVAVGEGRYDDGERVPMSVSVGDSVLFSKYGFDEVKIDGQEYYVLSESSVLAVLG